MLGPTFVAPSPLPFTTPRVDSPLTPPITTSSCRSARRSLFLAVSQKPRSETSNKASTKETDETNTRSQSSINPVLSTDSILGTVISTVINLPILKPALRYGARNVLISTAERSGIPWRSMVADLNQALPKDSEQRRAALHKATNPDLTIPSYFYAPYHAYPDGNLSWLAAFEALPATMSMAMRTLPGKPLETAIDLFRSTFFKYLVDFTSKGLLLRPQLTVIDVGCGVGISTRDLASRLRSYRGSQLPLPVITGLDGSPQFLVVAEMLQEKADAEETLSVVKVDYKHRFAENTGFESDSVDLVSLQFVVHEMPNTATRQAIKEAFRVLKSGGALAIMDGDPTSDVMRSLPPALATLMKSTEPYMDDYYSTDFEQELVDAGFVDIKTGPTDPRDSCIVGTKP